VPICESVLRAMRGIRVCDLSPISFTSDEGLTRSILQQRPQMKDGFDVMATFGTTQTVALNPEVWYRELSVVDDSPVSARLVRLQMGRRQTSGSTKPRPLR
jgi:hypothetical protein